MEEVDDFIKGNLNKARKFITIFFRYRPNALLLVDGLTLKHCKVFFDEIYDGTAKERLLRHDFACQVNRVSSVEEIFEQIHVKGDELSEFVTQKC